MNPGAFICPGCDFILDATFLGDDITDDERDKRPVRTSEQPRPQKPARGVQPDFGEDAMILGDVNQVGEVSSFNSRDAGVSQREVTQARFYIGGAVAQLMMPDAIPEPGAGVTGVSIRMTPFERHVLSFVNGRRSVGRIQKKSAMDESEFKTALAMLADKGFIRLKGWKKQKEKETVSSGSGALVRRSSSSSSSAAASSSPPAPAAERTVVASMEHIEALAKAAAEAARAAVAARTRIVPAQSLRPASDELRDTPVQPREQATSVGPAPSVVAASRRFASLQAQPAEELDDDVADPLAAAAAADWDAGDNQSSVFSEGSPLPQPRASRSPSLVDSDPVDDEEPAPAPVARRPLVATRPTGHFAAADDHDDDDLLPEPGPTQHGVDPGPDDVVGDPDGFDDGFTGDGLAALRDPTGMGDSLMAGSVAEHGAPIRDDDDVEFDDEEDDADEDDADEDPDEVAADEIDSWHEADLPVASTTGTVADDDIDDALLGPPRRIHDEHTAAPIRPSLSSSGKFGRVTVGPSAPVPEVFDDSFDLDPPRTSVQPKPLTLSPSALMPVEPAPPPSPPPRPAPPVTVPRLATPAAVVVPSPAPSMTQPLPTLPPSMTLPSSSLPPAPAPLLSIPGQALVTKQTPPLPTPMPGVSFPTPGAAVPSGKPMAATRVSAASSVPFELRKKAERIYEQALKDQAEGRLSSALMNAKLAMNFDGSVDAYKQLFEALNTQKAQPQGPRPRELVLFEQASEAEGKGDHLRAVKLLEEAIAANPRAAALYNRLGVVLSIRLKRHDEALAHLKKAIELEPGSIVYMNNFSKVTGLLESVLEKDPKARKRGTVDEDAKIGVKKLRPKMF